MKSKDDYLTKPEIYDCYPEMLTHDQFDNIKWDECREFNCEDTPIHLAGREAFDYIKKNGGVHVLYTLIDGEQRQWWDKGWHLCNRTGRWMVVKQHRMEQRHGK